VRYRNYVGEQETPVRPKQTCTEAYKLHAKLSYWSATTLEGNQLCKI